MLRLGKTVAKELLDIIDKDNSVVGQAMKSIVHQKGLRHRVSAVLLQREDGKYLIPTAAEIKVEAGRLFHSAAGHVLCGESYSDSVRRELREETGLSTENLEYLGTFWFEKNYPGRKEKERFEVYRVAYRKSMESVRLNEEQIKEKWLSEEELKFIYTNKSEEISGPLRMTCRLILDFDKRSCLGS